MTHWLSQKDFKKIQEYTTIIGEQANLFLNKYSFPQENFFKPWWYVAGGSFPTFYHDGIIHDIDFFPIWTRSIDKLKDHVKKNNIRISLNSDDYVMDNKNLVYESDTALTFPPNEKGGPKLQFITNKSFIGSPETILKTKFDFVHCTSYYTLHDRKFHISPYIMKAVREKKLYIRSNTHSLQKRIDKWAKRGYEFENIGDLHKLTLS